MRNAVGIGMLCFALCAPGLALAKMDSARFAKKVAEANKAEIEMGNLAKDKAASSDVKNFAQRMVDDHTKATSELQQIAGNKKIALANDLSRKHKRAHDKAAKLTGAKFDQAYMKDMVKDHEDTVKDFRKQAKEGTDAGVKAFAAKTLPTLEEHLAMAKSVYANVKNSGAQSGTPPRMKKE